MSLRARGIHRAGYFGEQRRDGLSRTEFTSDPSRCAQDSGFSSQSASPRIDYRHREVEAGCRKYWVYMYGADAERRSRGGVQWMRGCGRA